MKVEQEGSAKRGGGEYCVHKEALFKFRRWYVTAASDVPNREEASVGVVSYDYRYYQFQVDPAPQVIVLFFKEMLRYLLLYKDRVHDRQCAMIYRACTYNPL